MRKVLLNACEKTGIADEDSLYADTDANALVISTTRVTVALVRSEGRQVWRVLNGFDVADLHAGTLRASEEVVGTFAVNDVASVVKAAVMKVVESVVDAAIDEASA